MNIQRLSIALVLSLFAFLIGCDADINADRALNIMDPNAVNFKNIAGEFEFESILITTTTEETFTIYNSGTAEIKLLGNPLVEITSEGDLAFSVTEMPETVIAPNEYTTFTIEFAPTVSKYYEAAVTIVSNDTDMSPFTFSIHGTGLEPGINVKLGEIYIPNNTGSYDFGNFRVLETTPEVTFTIENSGTYELNLTGEPFIAIIGSGGPGGNPGEGLFNINLSSTTSPIAPGAATTFTVSFTPQSVGLKEITISIANDDFNKDPYVFTVKGTGVQPEINVMQGATDLVSGTDSFDFGNVRVTETSSDVVFTIENLGTDTLYLTGSPIVEVTGADAAMFTVVETMTKSEIAPANATTFSISFNPTSDGAKTATISIANDDFDENLYTFEITGTGTIPEINVKQGSDNLVSGSGSYDFGTVMRFRTSKPVLFTIENLGTADLILSGSPKINISGSGASHFDINEVMTVSPVSPSNSTLFEISFCPTSIGKKTATVSIANDDNNENPYTFTVTGKTTTFDFNGDGYDDVLVGADSDDDGGSSSGCAFIFFGSSSPYSTIDAASASVRLIGRDSYDYFGRSVSCAGDVNGDGFDDVIVGAEGDDDSGLYSGSAFIFYGRSNPPTVIDAANADVQLIGKASYDYFGSSVSGAGDVNGDGYDDVIVGAYGDDDGGSYSGCSFVFYGSSSMSSVIDAANANVRLIGVSSSDYFGYSVSSAGDVNADGYDDVIVGAYNDDDGGSESGCAFIFYGGSSIASAIDASNADVRLVGENTGDYFGYSVSNAGDVNGDGYDDIIVGAPSNDNDGRSTGAAYFFFGKQSLTSNIDASNADVKMYSSNDYDYCGYSVSCAGDVDGDGLDDVIIGADSADHGGNNTGSAFVVLGNSIFLSSMSESYLDVEYYGYSPSDYFGSSVSGAGDFNGDGFADVIVGAAYDDDGGTSSGCAFIFMGQAQFKQSTRANDARVRLIGGDYNDHFGESVGGGR